MCKRFKYDKGRVINMKFEVTRDIENRIFTVAVNFKELGSDTLSAEAELEIYKDFGFPKVDIGGSFESVNFADDTFILNKKIVEVLEGFTAVHTVKLDAMEGDTDQEKIKKAEAQCSLFEEVILKRLGEAVKEVQAKASVFSEGYPKDVII